MSTELAGKTAIVTGAARGIGRAVAQKLAGSGAAVTICDVLDCSDTAHVITTVGGAVKTLSCDVCSEADVIAVFAGVQADVVVHCAGIIDERPLLETSAQDFDRVININLRGSFLVGREALRGMSAAGEGRLIMIASDLAYAGRETFSAYVASKHGVLGLVRSWAKEFGPDILVNAICPGPIDTAMLDAENMSPEWRKKELAIPLARFGQPDEIGDMAVFLAGPGGRYITGQGIGVNGGSVMP